MSTTPRERGYGGPRFKAGLSTFSGLFGICMQFFGDLGDYTVLLILPGSFALLDTRTLDEREHQLLYQAYGMTFTGFFFALMIAYSIIEWFRYLGVAQGVVDFLNTHWLGLTWSLISLLLGTAGLRVFRKE